jgi:pepF/M3 family oligoendopeptidase
MKKWNLDALYTSFDSKEFQNALVETEKLINDLTEFTSKAFIDSNDAVNKINTYLEKTEKLRKVLVRAYMYCSLNLSVDALNEEARKYLNQMQQLSSRTTLSRTLFSKWVPTLGDLDKLIDDNDTLKEVKYYLNRIVEGSKYLLSDKEEILLSKLQQTGSTAWGQLQSELTATLKVDYNGKEITLSEVRNLSSDKDPKVRKAAYEAELAAYPKIAQSVAYALNGVKGEVNTLCDLRGFESALDQAVYQSRMEKSTLDALIESMKEYLPHFHKYLRRKGELLGHKNGLPYYDIFAPMGESSKEFTIDEAMDYIFDNFSTFGPELEALARRAKDEEWIDYTPRQGKRGGAFCANIHSIKQSRIMTNFSGSFSGVITLAHELGHAYHGDQIFKERLVNASYTMPVAETASTFCETIVKNAALKDAEKAEKITILEQSLKGSTQVVVDILSRFIFEGEVFDKRKTTPLNPRMLNEMMISAQKTAYGDSLDHDYLMPYAWLNKGHYYRGGLSFYNFPYAFGLLFAKGIYAEFIKQGAPFVEKINLLLRKTGQMSVEDVASLVGLDISSREFWNSSLDVVVKEIDLFLELTK